MPPALKQRSRGSRAGHRAHGRREGVHCTPARSLQCGGWPRAEARTKAQLNTPMPDCERDVHAGPGASGASARSVEVAPLCTRGEPTCLKAGSLTCNQVCWLILLPPPPNLRHLRGLVLVAESRAELRPDRGHGALRAGPRRPRAPSGRRGARATSPHWPRLTATAPRPAGATRRPGLGLGLVRVRLQTEAAPPKFRP